MSEPTNEKMSEPLKDKNVSTTGAVLGLMAQTPIHAGAGKANGVIDLPIQREAHTAWPCIYASSVKGGLRELARERITDAALITKLFGAEGTNAEMAACCRIGRC